MSPRAARRPVALGTRSAGVLLHPTSLPGPHGIGDLGPEAHRFAAWLAAAGQSWWQTLPVGPVGAADSPYTARSAMAGEPLLLSLEVLRRDGLLRRGEVGDGPRLPAGRVDWKRVRAYKEPRLRLAWERLHARRAGRALVERFAAEHADWLDDYALFRALRTAHGNAAWATWPEPLRRRRPAALAAARRELAGDIAWQRFLQYEFHRQWSALRQHAASLGVGLIGDLPIFVALESADVWAHPELFHLGRDGRPTVVAGVPPDYFSASGQRWGNPLYRWSAVRRRDYAWWRQRLHRTLELFDAVRLDHFIGFVRYWEIPASARDARVGRWRPGPGAALFRRLLDFEGQIPIIAEDLGLVTPEVRALRDRFEFPGMRVLQFAFGNEFGDNEHLPHRHPVRSVVYTGTHDNDTAMGWFQDLRRQGERSATARRQIEYTLRYLDSDGRELHWDLIRLALLSPAATAIVPLQDLLGLGSEARMNTPGTTRDNWQWRFAWKALKDETCDRLRRMTKTYGRLPPSERPKPRPK